MRAVIQIKPSNSTWQHHSDYSSLAKAKRAAEKMVDSGTWPTGMQIDILDWDGNVLHQEVCE